MAERLSAPMREGLDALVAVDDDQPHSPLNQIKASSANPSVGGMKRLLARLELIEATGVLELDVGWVNGNYQRILFHTVRTASADRVRRMAAPRRHLALVCFLHQAWRDTLDQAVDMYGKLLDRNRKLVEARLDDMLKAQRQAVDRIVHRYRRLGAVLLDPDVGDDELRARLLSTVPEAQLREDQSDLASWTRGDRKARFEQTAERHAGLSRFAGPFLSRMKFVDEQGEGASPTLSALRAYREHRAAGRRGVPPDAPLDFAPAALQPLIRQDGVTDRRRWESALFLKVRDEIQTGNLAIDGAKNFGRFEAFFLPAAQWERVRDAFWARTGFPVAPAAAVQQLKARLSDAFDRFLEGVADNRQVAFDDDGWRLKADAAEQPDPAQIRHQAPPPPAVEVTARAALGGSREPRGGAVAGGYAALWRQLPVLGRRQPRALCANIEMQRKRRRRQVGISGLEVYAATHQTQLVEVVQLAVDTMQVPTKQGREFPSGNNHASAIYNN